MALTVDMVALTVTADVVMVEVEVTDNVVVADLVMHICNNGFIDWRRSIANIKF